MTTKQFKEKLELCNESYRKGEFKVVSEYISCKEDIELLCRLNCLHKMRPHSLYKGAKPSQRSAINKNTYWIARARKVHGDTYDYTKVNYVNVDTHVIISCSVHGDFKVKPYSHIQGVKCKKCYDSIRSSLTSAKLGEFIKKSKSVHGDRYDYHKVNYINNKTKVILVCKEHGDFETRPDTHLSRKHGCPKCGNRAKSKKLKEQPVGWTKTNWFNTAQTTDAFTSWKVYFIECWDEETNERFIKVGRTFTKLSKRFYPSNFPYKFKILKVVERKDKNNYKDMEYIYNLENRFKRLFKKFKHIPKKEFGGDGECFSINFL